MQKNDLSTCLLKLLLATTVAKNDCLEFLNIYNYRCNLVLKFFDNQGKLLHLGRVYFGIQLSMIVIQVPSQLCRAWFRSGVLNSCS